LPLVVDQKLLKLEDIWPWMNEFETDGVYVLSRALSSRAALRLLPLLVLRGAQNPPGQNAEFLRDIFHIAIVLRITGKVSPSAGRELVQKLLNSSTAVLNGNRLLSEPSLEASLSVSLAHERLHAWQRAAGAIELVAEEVERLGGGPESNSTELDKNSILEATLSDAQASVSGNRLLVDQISAFARMANLPLWKARPQWWIDSFAGFEHLLISETASGQVDWTFWREWYKSVVGDTRLLDHPNEVIDGVEHSIAIGRGNDEFWLDPPQDINAKIVSWVAELQPQIEAAKFLDSDRDAIPELEAIEQSTSATMFSVADDGRIDLAPAPPEQRLFDSTQQRQEYRQLRADARLFLAQGQILGKLEPELDQLVRAMPENLVEAVLFDVWRAINRLRRTHNAHKALDSTVDPHPAKLDPSVAEELAFLLDSANNFAFSDPGLRQRDEATIAPQDKLSLEQERELGDAIIEAALERPELTTEAAISSLQADEKNVAEAADDPHSLQAIDQSNRTRRNLVAALFASCKRALSGEVRFAWKEVRGGAYKAIGASGIGAVVTDFWGTTAIYPSIWRFFVDHATNLKLYSEKVFHNPSVVQFLDWLTNLTITAG
jgi:hypothetical protein